MNRIQVANIRYGYKIGNSYVAVKTYRNKGRVSLLSFALPVPLKNIRDTIRAEILKRRAGGQNQ